MSPTNTIARFGEYAAAFEEAFKGDDWSVLEPYFTEDAVYELFGGPPFAGRHEGRDAIFSALKASLDSFDRRFDTRELDLLEGPEIRDDAVWMHWRVTYTLEGAPELSIEGEERAYFDGDRIRRLEDQFADEASKTTLAYFEQYAAKLGASPS